MKDNHLRLGHEVETSKLRNVSSEIDRSEINYSVILGKEYCKVSLRNLILENALNIYDEDYCNLTGLLYDQFEELVSRRSSSPTSAVLYT